MGRSWLVAKILRLLQMQPVDDVLAGVRIGGGGERDARHMREQLGEPAELAIVGPEIMAPLADAMRLVDGEQRDIDIGDELQEAGRHDPLGRDVEQIEARRGAAGCVHASPRPATSTS